MLTSMQKEGWTKSQGDSVYGIERKIFEPNMVEYLIPWQFSVSHDKLSLTAGGRPMDFIYQSDSKASSAIA